MKTPAASALGLLLILVAPAALRAQSVKDLEKVVDLEATIKSLSQRADAGDYKALPKFVILNGSLDNVFDTDESAATVIVELATGEWIGLEDVKSYHCLVRFQGEKYLQAFPAIPPRNAGPEVFARSSRLLVVAAPMGVVELQDGRIVWLLDGVYLRRL